MGRGESAMMLDEEIEEENEDEATDGLTVLPSSVPSKGRRRESIGAQMRRAAGGGVSGAATSGSAFSTSFGSSAPGVSSISVGSPGSAASSTSTIGARPIGIAGGSRARSTSSTFRAGPGAASVGAAGGFPASYSASSELSTSFGAAAEQLSLSIGAGRNGARPGSMLSSSYQNGSGLPIPAAGGRRKSRSSISGASSSSNAAVDANGKRSLGHSHFGQECFGPDSFDAALPNIPPSKAALDQLKADSERRGKPAGANNNGNAGDSGSEDANSSKGDAASVTSSAATKDSLMMGTDQLLHKCESCAKVYRHPSCLIKHRWVSSRSGAKFALSVVCSRAHTNLCLVPRAAVGAHCLLERSEQVPAQQAPASAAA